MKWTVQNEWTQEALDWSNEFTRTTGRVAAIAPHPTRKGFYEVVSNLSAGANVYSRKQLREAIERLKLRPDFKKSLDNATEL